jgi:hypothetical protein
MKTHHSPHIEPSVSVGGGSKKGRVSTDRCCCRLVYKLSHASRLQTDLRASAPRTATAAGSLNTSRMVRPNTAGE